MAEKKGWKDYLGMGIDLAGPLLEGRAAGRAQENQEQALQDELALRMAGFNQRTPLVRAGTAALGDVMSGVQDFTLSGEGRNLVGAGGLRPSLLGPAARGVGSQIARTALLNQMGEPVTKEASIMGNKLKWTRPAEAGPYGTVKPTPRKKPGLFDKILGGVKFGGKIATSLLGL